MWPFPTKLSVYNEGVHMFQIKWQHPVKWVNKPSFCVFVPTVFLILHNNGSSFQLIRICMKLKCPSLHTKNVFRMGWIQSQLINTAQFYFVYPQFLDDCKKLQRDG